MRSGNPFANYLERHPEADARALKELFRILAKRTHPDAGAEDEQAFVRLQDYYHETLASLESHPREARPADSASGSPRTRMLRNLYRYKALLPRGDIDARLPQRAEQAMALAVEAAGSYRPEARTALQSFEREFHGRRREIARYPDIRVKYKCLFRALVHFFDYEFMPNEYNLRLTTSYLDEIHPVDDYDPTKPAELRTNRSASARAALYQVRRMLEHELSLPAADLT